MWEVFLFLLFTQSGTIRGQVVEFEAPSELRRGVEALTIKCSPSLDGFNFINRLEIKRKGTQESAYRTVLEVFDPPRGSNPNFKDEKLGARATAEGRGGRVSGAFLSLTAPVDMVNCEDNASYQCKITHTGVNNQTLTVTSASVSVRMTANPSATPPVFSLSPPNVPGTTNATYLKGTTIALVCSAEVGAPALSLRVCHHPLDSNSSSAAAKTLVDTVTPTSSEPSENCILSRTIVSTFTITDGSGTFTCEVHNATSACGGKNVYKPSTLSYTGIDYPVCNVSNASVAVTSTPVPEMTTINEVIIGGNVGPEVLASTATGGFTLLVLGCVLITLSGILFAASVILFLKSKKLRQDAEVTMIRSTYDSVHFNTGSAPNYTSLDDLTQSPRRHPKLEKLDSDGYMVPSTNNPR